MLYKKFLFLFLLGIISPVLLAQVPDGYYADVEGLTDGELKAALHAVIDDHVEYPYSDGGTDTWDILKQADKDPENSENVILIYTGKSVNAEQEYNNGNGWNREHVWAKSHGDFGNEEGAGTDAHHLRPSDISVNADRSSKDFDNGGTQHNEATGCYYTSNTWEPRDDVKGDIARMMFYMAVSYEGDVSGEPDLELVNFITYPTSEPLFGMLSTLIEWHYQDPVDHFERNRNEVIYSYQKNRNPFIDRPEFVADIWGGGQNIPPAITQVEISPESPTSADEVTVSASITDPDGTLTLVELFWGLSADNLSNTINMTNTSGDIYTSETSIPGQANGISVFFEVTAKDDSGSVSVYEDFYTIEDANALNRILKEQIKIFPNPATNRINIIIPGYAGTVDCKLYNEAGALRQIHTIQSFNQQEILLLEKNISGICFLKISTAEGLIITRRLIVNHSF